MSSDYYNMAVESFFPDFLTSLPHYWLLFYIWNIIPLLSGIPQDSIFALGLLKNHAHKSHLHLNYKQMEYPTFSHNSLLVVTHEKYYVYYPSLQ